MNKRLKNLLLRIEKTPKLFYFLIFLLAFIVHIIGLNQIGRTWDEEYRLDYGQLAWDLIANGDFSKDHWDTATEHPMVGKYIYGYAQVSQSKLVKNAFTGVTVTEEEYNKTLPGNNILTTIGYNTYVIPYDYTFARLLSALFNSLAVVMTVVIASYYVSKRWALLAGLFLLLTPRFVFLGQLATFESISVCIFCLTIIVFRKLLSSPKELRWYLFTGVLSGLFFWTRYNNVIIFPFLAGWLGLNYLETKNRKLFNWKLLIIPTSAFLLGIAIWPTMWHDFPKPLLDSFLFHENRFVGLSFYYWKYFLFATSIPLLFGFFLGLFICIRKRDYNAKFLLWWVVLSLIMYTIFCIRLGGTRYTVILYPAIAILAVIGYKNFLRKKYVFMLIPILLFIGYEHIKSYPYYLDYYNQIIGGRTGAINAQLDFSWWGEGQRDAGLWLKKNGFKNSRVGLLVTPKYVFPRLRQDQTAEFIEKPNDADYIVVTRRMQVDKDFYDRYSIVHTVSTGGEGLIYVYKKNNPK